MARRAVTRLTFRAEASASCAATRRKPPESGTFQRGDKGWPGAASSAARCDNMASAADFGGNNVEDEPRRAAAAHLLV